MEVTLKKAADLARAALSVSKNVKINTNYTVSLYGSEENRIADIDRARDKLNNDIHNVSALIDANYTIRELIGAANAQCGVDDFLTQRAKLDAKEKAFVILASHDETGIENCENLTAISERVHVMKTKKSDDLYGRSRDSFDVSLLTDRLVEEYDNLIAQFRREKSDLSDKIAGLNLNTKITLPTDVVETLVRNKILDRTVG